MHDSLNSVPDISKLAFGSDDAERDAQRGLLDKVFLKTKIYERARDGTREIIVGRKGTGKSAICLTLKHVFENEGLTAILVLPQALSYTTLEGLKTNASSSSEAYVSSWKYVLLTRVGLHLLDLAKTQKQLRKQPALRAVRHFLADHGEIKRSLLGKVLARSNLLSKISLKIAGVEGSIETRQLNAAHDHVGLVNRFEECVQLVLAASEDTRTVLLIDRIDEVWSETRDSELMIIGLLKAVHHLNSSLAGVRILLFLRSDIYDVLKFSDADKFRSLEERLTWNDAELKDLITKRARVSTGLPAMHADDVWSLIFDREVSGQHSFEYIVDRTIRRPRELIQFCGSALALAQDRGHKRITESDILSAEGQYSAWKLNDLASEFAVQYPFLDAIFGLFQGFKRTFTREEFGSRYKESCDALVAKHPELQSLSTNAMLQILFGIGFVGANIQDKSVYVYDEPNLILSQEKIVVHPAFHLALSLQRHIVPVRGNNHVVVGGVSTGVNVGGDVVRGTKVVISREADKLERLIEDYKLLVDNANRSGGIGSPHDAAKVEWKLLELRKRAGGLSREELNSDQAQALHSFVEHLSRSVEELADIRENANRIQAVNECVVELNALSEELSDKQLVDPAAAHRTLDRLLALQRKVADARRIQQRGSEGWQVLERVEEARRNAEKQLRMALRR
jgi:hypothetical protein